MVTGKRFPSAEEIKTAAKAQGWESVLRKYIDPGLLDGKKHPCPNCEGTDRFNAFKDFQDTGGVACNQCGRFSDGIAVVAWQLGNPKDMGAAMKQLSADLGLKATAASEQTSVDIIAEVARDKSMPLEAFKQFKPEPYLRGRGQRFCARLPVYSERLERCGYFDIDPGGKGRFGAKDSHGLFMQHDNEGNPIALQPGEFVCVVEGVKDAAALVALGYRAIGLPTSSMHERFAHVFKGCHVTIVPDLDKAANEGTYKTGGRLQGIAASVKVARLPGEHRASNGEDVRDVIKKHGEQVVRDEITRAEPWQPRDGEADLKDGRPEVYVTLNEAATASQVSQWLGKLGWESPWLPVSIREVVKIYQRGGLLVSAVPSVDPGRNSISVVPIPPAIIRERITQACQLLQERLNKDGETETVCVQPPRWLYDSIHQRAFYGDVIKPLTGIIQAPTIRSDGTILQNPGWDRSTGLLYRPQIDFPRVPQQPTQEDAKQAAAELLEVVADFPLQNDSDRSAWLALVLTMIARDCIDGCCPLFPVDSNIRGSGKSLVIDAASCIAYGKPAARRVFTRNDEEQRKVITTTAIEASPSVLLDNVDQQLGGAALDAALTSRTWNDRLLCTNKTTGEIPLRTVWTATGNNLNYGTDIARRVLPIRMMSPLESPEDRTDFKHPDLIGWVLENRPRLAVAALTLLRAYFAAGKPKQPGKVLASYETWSHTIRGAIVWAGLAEPLDTIESAKASDDSRQLLGMLITGLREADPDGNGVTCKEIERLITHRPDETPMCPTLVEAAAMICGTRFDARGFGKKLRGFKNRNCEGWIIDDSGKGHGNVKKWTAIRVENTEPSDSITPTTPAKPPLSPPQKPNENKGEDTSGGNGGNDSKSTHIGSECVSTHTHINTDLHTHTHTYSAPVKTLPPLPPSPPAACAGCGQEMTCKPAGPGRIEWECSRCGFIYPQYVDHEPVIF